MKRIMFVEKEEATYDPVSAFFNKKTQPIGKPPSSIKPNRTGTIEKEKPKEQTAKSAKPYPTKEQILKTREPSRGALRKDSKLPPKESKASKIQQPSTKTLKTEEPITNIPQPSTQLSLPPQPTPPHAPPTKNRELESLHKKISELQARQTEYLRKLQEYQAQQQKNIKNEQKLTKLQAQLKAASAKTKQTDSLTEKLKERDAQIKELLDSTNIPFSRKRQALLNNKIRQLKQTNRELVLRLKNYKGGELTQMASQQTREEIMRELYTVDTPLAKEEMNSEIERIAASLAVKMKQYMQIRSKLKGERLPWAEQQKLLLQLVNLAEQLSLNYLKFYQICPLPSSNQAAQPIYSLLQEYRTSNQLQKIADRLSLNFTLSRDNADIVQHLQNGQQEQLSIRAQIRKIKPRGKAQEQLRIYEQRANFNEVLLVQNVCQVQLLKEWMEKAHGRISEQLGSLNKTLGEVKTIVQLGPAGSQSLLLFLQQNLSLLQAKFPQLKITIKNCVANFNAFPFT